MKTLSECVIVIVIVFFLPKVCFSNGSHPTNGSKGFFLLINVLCLFLTNKHFSERIVSQKEREMFFVQKWFSLIKSVLFIFSSFSFFDKKRLFLDKSSFLLPGAKKKKFKKERFLQKKRDSFKRVVLLEQGLFFF